MDIERILTTFDGVVYQHVYEHSRYHLPQILAEELPADASWYRAEEWVRDHYHLDGDMMLFLLDEIPFWPPNDDECITGFYLLWNGLIFTRHISYDTCYVPNVPVIHLRTEVPGLLRVMGPSKPPRIVQFEHGVEIVGWPTRFPRLSVEAWEDYMERLQASEVEIEVDQTVRVRQVVITDALYPFPLQITYQLVSTGRMQWRPRILLQWEGCEDYGSSYRLEELCG